MKQPDLLVCWIKHCDYPIFRRFLRRHRQFFGKVIIYWSEHFRDMYYDEFIQNDLKGLDIEFLPNVEYHYGVEDWRNVATHEMLKHSTGEWVCSVEQDFFARDWKELFTSLTTASHDHDLLGYKGYQGQAEHQAPYLKGIYVHPAFWFMKREALEKTNKNFSADPTQGVDHFGLITRDAQRLGISTWYTQDNGFSEALAFHQGGINMNYLESQREGFVFHRPEQFYLYNYWSMQTDVAQSDAFMELCRKVDLQLSKQFPALNPDTDDRKVFYV